MFFFFSGKRIYLYHFADKQKLHVRHFSGMFSRHMLLCMYLSSPYLIREYKFWFQVWEFFKKCSSPNCWTQSTKGKETFTESNEFAENLTKIAENVSLFQRLNQIACQKFDKNNRILKEYNLFIFSVIPRLASI